MNRRNKTGFFLLFLLGWANGLSAQSDSAATTTPNERMVKTALSLLDVSYQANTLEVNEEEQLVVNLQAVDCLTFVENCLALSRAAQYPDTVEDYFVRELRYIRYREGVIDGYTSRLHYTTDWITDNINKEVIEDLTYALGGKKFLPQVNFMSSHPELYPILRKNSQAVETMKKIEQTINRRQTYYYIPAYEIREKQSLIKSGDIICFTTGRSGLDISHVGIAYKHNGQMTFIHASTVQKKVIIQPESLADYCGQIKSNTGIMVLRPLAVNRENESF